MTIRDFAQILPTSDDVTLTACRKLNEESATVAVLDGDGTSTSRLEWDPWA